MFRGRIVFLPLSETLRADIPRFEDFGRSTVSTGDFKQFQVALCGGLVCNLRDMTMLRCSADRLMPRSFLLTAQRRSRSNGKAGIQPPFWGLIHACPDSVPHVALQNVHDSRLKQSWLCVRCSCMKDDVLRATSVVAPPCRTCEWRLFITAKLFRESNIRLVAISTNAAASIAPSRATYPHHDLSCALFIVVECYLVCAGRPNRDVDDAFLP